MGRTFNTEPLPGGNNSKGHGHVPGPLPHPEVSDAAAIIHDRDCRYLGHCRYRGRGSKRFREGIQIRHRRIVLVLTIVFWDLLINWLSYRFKPIERLLAPAPLTLIENGRMNRRNMRKELITEEELRSQMRQQGVNEFEEVKRACLEATGEISVVKIDASDSGGKKRKKPG